MAFHFLILMEYLLMVSRRFSLILSPLVFWIALLAMLGGIFLLSATASANYVETDHVYINGESSRGVTIKPKANNEYSGVKWLDQNDNNVGMLLCHENQTQGDPHNHCTMYTAMQDRTQRTGRMDLTFGEDFANLTFEDVWINFEKGAYMIPILKGEDGNRYELYVDVNQTLQTRLVN